MYKGDDYYQKRIDYQLKQRESALLGIDVCLSYIDFKNGRQANSIRKRIRKMGNVDLSGANKIGNVIKKEISKLNNSSYISTIDVKEKLLEKQHGRPNLDIKDDQTYSMAQRISSGSIEALKSFIDDYVLACSRIEELREEQIQERKNDNETKTDKQKLSKDNISTGGSSSSYVYHNSSNINNSSEHTNTTKKSNVQNVRISDDSKKETGKELVERKLFEAVTHFFQGFNKKETEMIMKLYPEFAGVDDYHSMDILKKGIIINAYANKKEILPHEMMILGLETLEVVTKQLLFDISPVESELYSILDMRKTLENYKIAYDKYMKYYEKCSASEKEIYDHMVYNEAYTSVFGKTIATPELLKEKINSKVSKYIVENVYGYYPRIGDDKDYYSKTIHASRYMSVGDIAKLYRSIKKELEKYPTFELDEEQRKHSQDRRNVDMEKLQLDFALVVLSKMEEHSHSKENDISKMDEGQKKEFFEERNKKLAAICLEVFKEEPLSSILKDMTTRHDFNQKKETLIQTYEVKEEVINRVYGLSKVQKAFAQLTGKWTRYKELMEKPELNVREQEEIKRLFR